MRSMLGRALSIVALIILLAPAGCSSEPCDQAAEKLERCLQKLDCRDQDPTSITKCNSAKTNGQQALDELQSLPCTAQVKDSAETINSCPIDQVAFCNCFAM